MCSVRWVTYVSGRSPSVRFAVDAVGFTGFSITSKAYCSWIIFLINATSSGR
jgi:hypothetical protein